MGLVDNLQLHLCRYLLKTVQEDLGSRNSGVMGTMPSPLSHSSGALVQTAEGCSRNWLQQGLCCCWLYHAHDSFLTCNYLLVNSVKIYIGKADFTERKKSSLLWLIPQVPSGHNCWSWDGWEVKQPGHNRHTYGIPAGARREFSHWIIMPGPACI